MELNKDYDLDFEEFKQNPQTLIFKDWIEDNSMILEFGCHTGLLARVFSEQKNCKIDGIEGNRQALEKAKQWLGKSYCIDVEQIDTYPSIEKKYDYIIFSHILEHLRNPYEVLQKSKDYLKDDGHIIIGLPNVSNIVQRIDMLMGKFNYEDTGVMDNTHYTMFNYHTAIKMIKACGLQVKEYNTPAKKSPIKYMIYRTPIIWRISKFLPDWFLFAKQKPNLTDIIMLFKCNKAKVL